MVSLMISVGLALSVGVCLAGQVETKEPAGKSYKFKFGTIQPADAPVGRGAAKFAELVGAKTGGRVTVDVYPASQLGNEKDLIDAVEMGTLEFALGEVAEWAGLRSIRGAAPGGGGWPGEPRRHHCHDEVLRGPEISHQDRPHHFRCSRRAD